NAVLVLREPGATVRADEFFFDEDADGFRTPGEAALVERSNDRFDVGLAFAEVNLRGGLFGSAARFGRAALIELAAEKRKDGWDGFDFFNRDLLALLGDEADDALCGFFVNDRRQAGLRLVLFSDFAAVVAAKLARLEDCIESSGAAHSAQLKVGLAKQSHMTLPTVTR